jgi:hypothetical protein
MKKRQSYLHIAKGKISRRGPAYLFLWRGKQEAKSSFTLLAAAG